MCNGLGAMYIGKDVFTAEKIVLKPPAFTTKGVINGHFACCTSKACNYADRGLFGQLFGEQVDSSKITVNSQGVCVGPPHGCATCDGTQRQYCSPDLNRVDPPETFAYILLVKMVLVAWVFYLFLYTICYKGAQWHTGGNGMCPWWFRCTCCRPDMWKLKTKCVPRTLHSPRTFF